MSEAERALLLAIAERVSHLGDISDNHEFFKLMQAANKKCDCARLYNHTGNCNESSNL